MGVALGDQVLLEVAQRMKPFDLESWIVEWTRVAEKNEQIADKFAADGYKITANEYYLKAANFYREAACRPGPDRGSGRRDRALPPASAPARGRSLGRSLGR